MVKIRQHGPDGQLFDFNTFLSEIALLRDIGHWRLRVEWCSGEGALVVENLCAHQFADLPRSALEEMYRHIFQTIDGEFIGLMDGKEYCHLIAVDSSWWEITGPAGLEHQMLEKYGPYPSEV